MFTGIIETMGVIKEISHSEANISFWISSPISDQLKVDQSVSHSGICLTVDTVRPGMHRVTAITETLEKSNAKNWKLDDKVNLERCISTNGRFDGHFVQGHVDSIAECVQAQEVSGSWEFRFRFPVSFASLIVEKGSICLNGISLTIFDITNDEFSVAIIPYTYNNTNIRNVQKGSMVNLEFDLIGKYLQRHIELKTFQEMQY